MVHPQDRVEFETLIADTSAKLIHASPTEVKAAIETALGHLMAFFHATRCGLLTVGSDLRKVSIHASWCGRHLLGDSTRAEPSTVETEAPVAVSATFAISNVGDPPPRRSLGALRRGWEQIARTRRR